MSAPKAVPVRALRAFLGVACLVVVVLWAGPAALVGHLSTISPGVLTLIFLLTFAFLLLSAVGLRALLSAADASPIPFTKVLSATARSAWLGIWTPAFTGELALPFLLARRVGSLPRALAAFWVDRVITLIAVSLAAALAVFRYLGAPWIALGLLVGAGLGCVVLFVPLGELTDPFVRRWAGRDAASAEAVWIEIAALRRRPAVMLANAAATLGKMAAAGLAFYAAAQASGESAGGAFDYVVVLNATRLLNYLPITPGGVGVGEGGAAWLLSYIGAEPAPVVAAYILLRAVSLAVTGALAAWSFLRG